LTQIATGQTTSGAFNITLPSGANYASGLLVVSATFGSTSIRAFVTTASNIDVSPISEAAVQLTADALQQGGKTLGLLTITRADSIQSKVAEALAAETFSSASSISDAVAAAKSAASRNSAVTDAINAAVSGSASVTGVSYAVVTTTDYSSGKLATLALSGGSSTAPTVNSNAAIIHSDAVVTAAGGYVFVINRYGQDNIQVLDPSNGFSLIKQYSVGNGANPLDIDLVSASKAYVSRGNSTSILVVNPLTGDQLGTISLADFADADGIPEMGPIEIVGTKAFVAIQRLDRNTSYWDPLGSSMVAVIDTQTDALIDTDADAAGTQAISLVSQNPQAMYYEPASGKLLVSASGNYSNSAMAGGIDRIDPSTYHVDQLVSKTALNGSPGAFAVASSTKGYVVVSDASFVNSVVRFNPSNGSVGSVVYSAGGYAPSIGLDPYGFLLISDQSYTLPGIAFVDTTTDTLTFSPVSVGLMPFSIAFVTVRQ